MKKLLIIILMLSMIAVGCIDTEGDPVEDGDTDLTLGISSLAEIGTGSFTWAAGSPSYTILHGITGTPTFFIFVPSSGTYSYSSGTFTATTADVTRPGTDTSDRVGYWFGTSLP